MKPKFAFHEIVRVRIADTNDIAAFLDGKEGRIAGMAKSEQGTWSYAVFVYSLKECWSFEETELEQTGKMDEEARLSVSPHIRVVVDPATGEGRIRSRTLH